MLNDDYLLLNIFHPTFFLSCVCISQLVRAPACKAGDPGSNPGPGENFSLKLLIYDLPDGYSES